MNPPLPPTEYLLSCSEMSLRDLELAALDRAAQARKRGRLENEQADANIELAGITRWLIENRAEILDTARRTLDLQVPLEFPQRKRA